MRRLLSLALVGLMLSGCATSAADLRGKYQVPAQVTDAQLEDEYAACVDQGEQKGMDWSIYGIATAFLIPPLGIALAITGVTVSHGTRENCMNEWVREIRQPGPPGSKASGERLAPPTAPVLSTSQPQQPIGAAAKGEARTHTSLTTPSVAPRKHTKSEQPAIENEPTPVAAQGGSATRSASTPVAPQSAVMVAPRLTADRKTLVLLEEISEPAWKRQPQIDLGSDPSTGTPQLRVRARGMKEAPNISVICGTTVHSLSLTVLAEAATRSVAKYEVPKGIVVTMLASSTCRVALLGIVLQIPQRELSVVWSRSSRVNAPIR